MPVKRYNGTSWEVIAGDGVVGAQGASGTNGIDAGATLLSTTTLSGSTTTISSISQSYKNLVIQVYGITASADGYITFRPNASTTICDYSGAYNEATIGTGIFANASSTFNMGIAAAQFLSTSDANSFTINIQNYSDTTAYKPFTYVGGYVDNASKLCSGSGGGQIKTTSAISSVVFNSGANTMSTGTVKIYGVN